VEDATLEIGILGPLVVRVEGADVRLGERGRALVTALVIRRGQLVPVDVLAEVLWHSDPPRELRNALQAQVSRLRRSLGPVGEVVRTEGPGYRLVLPPGCLDADELEAAVLAARQAMADPAASANRLAAALTAWRGEPLPDAADDPEVVVTARRLEELRLAAIELRAEAVLTTEDGAELVADLQAYAQEHPRRERLHRALALALYRTGRQDEALTVLQDLQTGLRDDLGIDPAPQTTTLYRRILDHDPELSADAARSAATALPVPRTSFVGREAELYALLSRLRDHRLVTLIGPGGTGKTRLALEAAQRTAQHDRVEVAFVALGELDRGEDVLAAVASAIGVSATVPAMGGAPSRPLRDRLRARVAGRRLLLVLDNCEHVVDDAAAVADTLLDAGPQVRILATSRERLQLPGEVRVPLAPLDVLPPDADPAQLTASDAVQLFAERAGDVVPDFRLTADTAPDVARICARVDGLPLAIELAAARTATLPLATLADRLENRLDLLTGGDRTLARQRTLDDVVAWSHDLLDATQQRLFRRLGVFAGQPTPELVEAVCAGDGLAVVDVLVRLAELADRSLLEMIDGPDGPRVRMLETIRDVARRHLAADPTEAQVRERHARVFADRGRDAAKGLRGHEQLIWLERLDHEHEDLRQALRHLERTAPPRALRLVCDLAWFWWLTDQIAEGRTHLERVTAAVDADHPHLAVGHAWRAFLGLFDRSGGGELERVLTAARAVLEVSGDVIDPVDRATAELLVAYVQLVSGAGDAALDSARVGELVRAADDPWIESATGFALAVGAANSGRADDAMDHAGRAIAIAEGTGDRWARFQCLQLTAMLRIRRGDYSEARADLATARDLATELRAFEQSRAIACQRAAAAMLGGDLDQAASEFTAILAATPPGGDAEALAHMGLGQLAHRRGDEETSIAHHRMAADRFLAVGERHGAAESLAGVAFARAALDDPAGARAALDGALPLLEGLPPGTTLPLLLEAAAAIAVVEGQHTRASRCLGRAEALREPYGATLVSGERFDVDRIHEAVEAALGTETTAAEVASGREQRGLLPPLD
jgi:predicted ATPase/DNA-binding SARP family transcriptional activator